MNRFDVQTENRGTSPTGERNEFSVSDGGTSRSRAALLELGHVRMAVDVCLRIEASSGDTWRFFRTLGP